MNLRKIAASAIADSDSDKDQTLDIVLSILKDVYSEDAGFEAGPKNETLAEHRKHCEAEPGNCPFEKKLDECDTEIGKRDKKRNGNGVTPVEDAAYADAVKRGDRETALRMIREAAAKAMPNTKVVDWRGDVEMVFHGTPNGKFTIFDKERIGEMWNADDVGFFFTNNKKIAKEYSKPYFRSESATPHIFNVYLNLENPLVVDKMWWKENFGRDDIHAHDAIEIWDTEQRTIIDSVNDGGHDGVIISTSPYGVTQKMYVAFNPNQIKSADITYDDAGNLIPLSKRFNMESADIRDEATGKIRTYLELAEAQDADIPSLEKHDRRFHGGHFDAKTMTCKLRDDLAKTDKPDELFANHESMMSSLPNRKVREYLMLMKKKCPHLDPEETLEKIASIEDRKIQGDAFRWLMKGKVKLPEDLYKVKDARSLAEKAHKNPFSYETPQACINDLEGLFKRGSERGVKPIDPDTVPELSDKQVLPMGVTTYEVQDDRDGQAAMRKIIDTHWGKDANPWCLLHGDGHGNISDGSDGGYDAWHFWHDVYNVLPKRVAFKDGKLLAFMATDGNLDLNRYDDGSIDTENSSDSGLRGMYPEEYGQYEDWLDSSEGLENMASFVEWLDMNYSELLEPQNIAKHTDEEWWDRKDSSHVGIPIGNLPVPDDPFGRYADFEIRDGWVVKTTGFVKGYRGEDGFVSWYDNGNVNEEQLGDKKITYRENGSLESYEDDSDGGFRFGIGYDGEIRAIFWNGNHDVDNNTIKAFWNSRNRNRDLQGQLTAHLDETNGDLDIEDRTEENGISARYERGELVEANDLPSWSGLDVKDPSVQKRALVARDAVMRTFAKADSLKPKVRQIAAQYSRRNLDPRGKSNFVEYLKSM